MILHRGSKNTQEANNTKLEAEYFTFSVIYVQNQVINTSHIVYPYYRSMSVISTTTPPLQNYLVIAIYSVFKVWNGLIGPIELSVSWWFPA